VCPSTVSNPSVIVLLHPTRFSSCVGMPDTTNDGQLHPTQFPEFVGMPDTTNDGQLQWVIRYDHHHCHIVCRELICSTCTSSKVTVQISSKVNETREFASCTRVPRVRVSERVTCVCEDRG